MFFNDKSFSDLTKTNQILVALMCLFAVLTILCAFIGMIVDNNKKKLVVTEISSENEKKTAAKLNEIDQKNSETQRNLDKAIKDIYDKVNESNNDASDKIKKLGEDFDSKINDLDKNHQNNTIDDAVSDKFNKLNESIDDIKNKLKDVDDRFNDVDDDIRKSRYYNSKHHYDSPYINNDADLSILYRQRAETFFDQALKEAKTFIYEQCKELRSVDINKIFNEFSQNIDELNLNREAVYDQLVKEAIRGYTEYIDENKELIKEEYHVIQQNDDEEEGEEDKTEKPEKKKVSAVETIADFFFNLFGKQVNISGSIIQERLFKEPAAEPEVENPDDTDIAFYSKENINRYLLNVYASNKKYCFEHFRQAPRQTQATWQYNRQYGYPAYGNYIQRRGPNYYNNLQYNQNYRPIGTYVNPSYGPQFWQDCTVN